MDGIYYCKNQFWRVKGNTRDKLDDNDSKKCQLDLDSEASNQPSWIENVKSSAQNVYKQILNMPVRMLYIIGLALIFYAITLSLILCISSKLFDTILTYAKIAFIMNNGSWIQTLGGLRREFIKKGSPEQSKVKPSRQSKQSKRSK